MEDARPSQAILLAELMNKNQHKGRSSLKLYSASRIISDQPRQYFGVNRQTENQSA